MKFFELLEESVSVLRTNKMRTALSVLGIIIGIGSVITLMTLGQASQVSITERIQSLGANLLIISPGSSGSSRSNFFRGGGFGGGNTLKYEDALAIAESDRITTVDSVAASYSSRSEITYDRNLESVSVNGVTPEYFKLRNVELGMGEEISQTDIDTSNKVAIIGATAAEALFGAGVNPLGEKIRIEGLSFTVIGVTDEKGSMGGSNFDEVVYVPLTTAQKVLYGVDFVSSIYVGAKNENVMEAAENQVGFLLLEQHRLTSPSDADFTISSQADILETVNEVTQTFTTLLTGIAAISLVVGGIGIMNIMLVTVTERTREIGIRKALGAKRKSIISQFLIESTILTIIGGIIGVLLGLAVSYIITNKMDLPQVMSVESIALSVLVSTVIGILFGWYPAQKASKLQPIEALRYE